MFLTFFFFVLIELCYQYFMNLFSVLRICGIRHLNLFQILMNKTNYLFIYCKRNDFLSENINLIMYNFFLNKWDSKDSELTLFFILFRFNVHFEKSTWMLYFWYVIFWFINYMFRIRKYFLRGISSYMESRIHHGSPKLNERNKQCNIRKKYFT